MIQCSEFCRTSIKLVNFFLSKRQPVTIIYPWWITSLQITWTLLLLLQFLCTTFNWPIFNYCKYLIQFILRFQYGRQHEFWRRQSCSLFHSSITSKSQLMSVMKNLSQSQHCVPLHSIPVYSKGDNSNIKNWSAIFVVDTCGLHPC